MKSDIRKALSPHAFDYLLESMLPLALVGQCDMDVVSAINRLKQDYTDLMLLAARAALFNGDTYTATRQEVAAATTEHSDRILCLEREVGVSITCKFVNRSDLKAADSQEEQPESEYIPPEPD